MMFDETSYRADENNDQATLTAKEVYFSWYFYADYYVTQELKVYRKNQFVSACKVSLN